MDRAAQGARRGFGASRYPLRRIRLCVFVDRGRLLAEGEHECLHAGGEEGDLERAVVDGSRLAKQLIKPLLGDGSAALFVGVESVSVAGRFTIDEYAVRHGSTSRTRSHDEVDVAGVEAEEDSAAGAVEDALPTLDRPISCKSPMVQVQPVGRDVSGSAVRWSAVAASASLRLTELDPVTVRVQRRDTDAEEVVLGLRLHELDAARSEHFELLA
jgi:hypothetical protein